MSQTAIALFPEGVSGQTGSDDNQGTNKSRNRRPYERGRHKNQAGGDSGEGHQTEGGRAPQRFVIFAFATPDDGTEGEGVLKTHHQREVAEQAGQIGDEDKENAERTLQND